MVEIIHELPGRVRFRVRHLRWDRSAAERLEAGLQGCEGVRRASASSTTATVLVVGSPRGSTAELAGLVERLLRSSPGTAPGGGIAAPQAAGARVRPKHRSWHLLEAESVALHFSTSPERGVPESKALDALAAGGPNRLPAAARRSTPAILAAQLTCLPVALTGAAALLALAAGGAAEAALLVAIALTNAAIGTVVEARAEKLLNRVRKEIDLRARVLRDGRLRELPFDEVVPGDILELEAGTRLAADARVLAAEDLSVDEAALTGESLPVLKHTAALTDGSVPLGERRNMLFRGTLVVEGRGRAIVTATGADTMLGKLQGALGTLVPPEAIVAREVHGLMRRFIKAGLAAAVVAAGIGLLRGQPTLAVLRSALALLGSAIPSGLSTVTTGAFALGQSDLRRHRILVRRLRVLGNLAATQVVCFDKTGTLTLNRMTAAEIRVPSGVDLQSVPGAGNGAPEAPAGKNTDVDWLLQLVVLCNEAGLKPGRDPSLEGSSTEEALIRMAARAGIDIDGLRAAHPAVEVRSRTEQHAAMETRHRWDRRELWVMKGSPAEVLERCDRLRDSGKIRAVEAQRREWIEAQNFRMSGAGLRVLGVAYRWEAPGAAHRPGSDGWVWSGLVGLKDPVRRNARTVVQALHRAGIRTVVITGDQGLTAHRIGEELGLAGAEPLRILDAVDLKTLNGKGLGGVVTRTHVFARLSPTQKQQVIQAYQNAGLSVAMVGDGFNDVLALKVADVGIAMGRRGAELARRTADLVLEDDNLDGLLRAVGTGRAFYGNIRRSLAYVLACSHMDLAAELVSHTGRVAGASPLQSVWSSLASLVLALDPAEPDRLDRAPEHEGAVLLAEADTGRAVGDALRATAAAAMAGGMEVAGLGAGAFGRSVAVNQMLYALACRADGETARPSNRMLEALNGLVCGGYAAATLMAGGSSAMAGGMALVAGAWLSQRWTGRGRPGGAARRGAGV